jgi:protein O-mannosyl-transferase
VSFVFPRPHGWAVLALTAATVLAYGNSFTAGFALDSQGLIIQDSRVHAMTRENFDSIVNHTYWWPHGESGLYRPFTTFSFLFNYAVLGNGEQPAGYHAVNLLLHLANVLIVYALVWRLPGPAEAGHDRHIMSPGRARRSGRASGRPEGRPLHVFLENRTSVAGFSRTQWVAFAIALLWAVHPLTTEAVTNIVGRADLLAAFAVLSGLWIYLEIRDNDGRHWPLWIAGLTIVTAIGVFSKESAVVLPLLIVCYEAIAWDSGRSRRALPIGLIGTADALVVWLWQRSSVFARSAPAEFPFVDNPIVGATTWSGRLTAVDVIRRYLKLAAWPARLSCDYSYAQIPIASASAAAWIVVGAVALAAAAAIVIVRRRHPAVGFALVFALVTLLPGSNLVLPTGTIMAERLMYLPLVGLVAAAVSIAAAAARRWRAEPGAMLVLLVIVALFAGRTWTRNRDWHDDISLWSAAVRVSPLSFKTHRALAEALHAGDPAHSNLDRVLDEAEKSVAVLDTLPDVSSDYMTYRLAATYYLEKGDVFREQAADSAASAPPDSIRAYARAVPLLLKSLSIIDASGTDRSTGPQSADGWRRLSAAYSRLLQHEKAVHAATRARTLDPFNPIGYRQAAAALLSANRSDEAAIALMVGSLLTGSTDVRQQLIELYRRGLDRDGCAVIESTNGATLNPSCPMVRRHICAASIEAVSIERRASRDSDANRLETSAKRLGCS